MELRQLEYFVAIAETRSFTRAAERCSVVQPALSQQVRRLEAELGAQLLVRTTRRVALTDAGTALLDNARRILADVAHARAEIDAITGLVRGHLALGAIQFVPLVDVPRVLADFHAAYPGVDVVLRTADNERMLADVRAGVLDLAFLSFVPGEAPADLGRLDVLSEPVVAVVAAGHPLAHARDVELAALADQPFIELGHGSGLRTQTERAFSAAGLERHVALEVADLDDMLSLATLGLGVALLPVSLVQARANHEVRPLRLAGDLIRRSVALVWREEQPVSPSARAFLAAVRRALAPSSG
jgi:DNA-binding transcriptional LysR family regulator